VTVGLADGRTLVEELQTTSGYLSGASKRLHFGLGPLRTVTELSVRWPDGKVESFGPPESVDRVFLLTRGRGVAEPLKTAPLRLRLS
jgi:hypothetical protein